MSRDALVVGINTYQYLPSLKAPAQDAEAVAQQLHTYGEFRVQRLPEVIQSGKPQIGQKTQVSLRELEAALINLFKPRGSSVPQTALFYFSGHGIQRDAGIQEGYLALSDSSPDQGFYGLSLFWLRRLLQESPVKQRIIWLDCCHSGEFLNFLEADPGAHPGTDRLFMAASREYETAYESLEGQYSVFTEALLNGLDPNRLPSGIVTNHALTDWVNHSLKGELQQPLFESSGSEIILTRCHRTEAATSRPTTATIQSQDICPYRGLEHFDETHAEYFFGREDLSLQLTEQLSKYHFAAVVGASGSGKSSLVRAGLSAQLRQGKRVPGSQQWKIRLITPTEQPLKSLAAAFIDPDLSDLERAEQLRRAETFLQDGGVGLAQLVRASLPTSSASTGLLPEQRPRFVLIIDQFEEVFTLSQGSQAERERQEFFDCLLGAMSNAGDLLSVVVVLRSDFLGKFALYEGLAQQLTQHQITVPPLKYEQIKATIVRPAQKVGLVCEPNLVYTMMMDVIGAPGELPLLQYTLTELWRRRKVGEGGVARLTLDAYQELGGVRGTLQKRATEVFHSLTSEEQAVAKRVFLALTQLGEGTEDTRRRVAKSELVSPTFPTALVEGVLEKLVAAKLIITSQASSSGQTGSETTGLTGIEPPAQEIVDVIHETLIRSWSLLRGWLEENREMLRRQRRIEQAAQEWHQAGQPTTEEYLLNGLRLRDAEDFLKLHAEELSALAQAFIQVSYTECRRARQKSRRLQVLIPSLLAASLAVVLGQYYGIVRSQADQETQLQQATARERAAIAQAVIQDPEADPMTALLISRLAAQEETSYEVQASLRTALQNLRLQAELRGHQGAVQQAIFSPTQNYLATAGSDGTIQLWEMQASTIYNAPLKPQKVLTWSNTGSSSPASASAKGAIQSIRFSPDGQSLVATVQNSTVIKQWAVGSGELIHELTVSAAVKQVQFDPTGQWVAALAEDNSITIWQAKSGVVQARLPQAAVINDLQFSSDGQAILTAGEDGTATIWQRVITPQGASFQATQKLTHPEVVYQAVFDASPHRVITLCKDGKIRLWNRQNGQLQTLWPDAHQPTDRKDKLANPANPANLPNLANPANKQNPAASGQSKLLAPMQQIELSADQQTLTSIDANHQVWIWNLQSGRLQTKLNMEGLKPIQRRQAASSAASMLTALSPDRQTMVTVDAQPSPQGLFTAYLWDSHTGKQMGHLPGHAQPITAVQFSPDGTYIITASTDGTVRLWATEIGGELPAVQLPGPVASLAFLPNQVVQSPTSPTEGTDSVALAPAQAGQPVEWLPMLGSVANWQKWLKPMFNLAGKTQGSIAVPLNRPSQPTRIAGETLINRMVTVDRNGQLRRLQVVTDMSANRSANLPPNMPPSAAQNALSRQAPFSPVIAALAQFNGFHHPPLAAQAGFAAFAQQLSPGAEADLSLAAANPRLASDGLAAKLQHNTALSSSAMSADGQFWATANLAGQVSLYRVEPDQTLTPLYQIQNWRSEAESTAAAISQVVTTPAQSGATLGSATQAATDSPVTIRQLVFSPDGQQLLGIADDLTLRTWSVNQGQLMQVFRGHTATIRQASYSRDGGSIISASWDRTSRIWNAATGQISQVLPHSDAVSSAHFSPDGSRVVTAIWNGTIQLWSTHTGKSLFSFEAAAKAALEVQFSPTGKQFVTVHADGTAHLWDAATGAERAVLRSTPQNGADDIIQAFFSPDGQYVATLTKQGRVNLWAATEAMLLQIAQERTIRQLTPEECSQYLRVAADQCPQLP